LVKTWPSQILTDPGDVGAPGTDYYVRVGGAATREAGYQHRLAEFIGWALPQVSRWSGDPVPLYMEIVAPFLFIEQTRGWSRIAAIVPRYLQVRDPERRGTEFLLSLDSLTKAREYDELLSRREEVRAGWRGAAEAFVTRVEEAGARVTNLSPKPSPSWPPSAPIAIHLLEGDDWIGLDHVLEKMREEIAKAVEEVPRVEEVAEQVGEELAEAEDELREISGFLASAGQETREQSVELSELDTRIEALEEDRNRYADAIRLRDFGSKEDLKIEGGHCPTCDQALPSSLQGAAVGTALTLEDNKVLIDEELKTFKAVREDASDVLRASRQRHLALERRLREERRKIRALKATLVQPGDAPSQAAIAHRVRLADRVEQLNELDIARAGLEEELEERSEAYRNVLHELGEIGERGSQTIGDREKLEAFEGVFREQLEEYGFDSVPPGDIELARDSYLPFYNEKPLNEEKISASDNIRLVWAYVVGLLEMAREYETAHPGLLVLDEPGQQEIDTKSLEALLHRLARSSAYDQQVIVASSKTPDVMRSLLEGTDAALHQIDGYLLKPEA
jgi:hypothetical protein